MKRRLYIKKCLWCKKEFYPFSMIGKLCSNKCSGLWRTRKTRYEIICKNCNKQFTAGKSKNKKFCSQKCYINYKVKDGKIINCIICGKTRTATANELKRGNPKYCSHKCQGIGLSKQYIGKNNPYFKDGKNKDRAIERDNYRASIEYKNFLRTVFIRDKNKCVLCGVIRKRIKNGKGKNNNLTVHHIESWKEYPLERFNPDNGICICNRCHINIHKRIIPQESKNYIKKYQRLARAKCK